MFLLKPKSIKVYLTFMEKDRSKSTNRPKTENWKKKTVTGNVKKQKTKILFDYHKFDIIEARAFQKSILKWYDKNQRQLPWRKLKDEVQVRAYKVLVSEIMLQQTQVNTVITYYEKWMKKWPTLQDLSRASLEEVNEMWSGLGYYSRGQRLLQLAVKVVKELNSDLPTSPQLLQKLPGIGRYTAGAVASIAVGVKTPAVDGNVIRVITRLRALGGDTSKQSVLNEIWKISEDILSEAQPGEFNQAMMELGSNICSPKQPKCTECPVSSFCQAYKQSISDCFHDIEDCSSCLTKLEYNPGLGVTNYPQKSKKKPPRVEKSAVCVISRNSRVETQFYISQRSSTGLLANLWEFPSFKLPNQYLQLPHSGSKLNNFVKSSLKRDFKFGKLQPRFVYIGDILHLFSHIRQTYIVFHLELGGIQKMVVPQGKWVSGEQFLKSAVPTGMKKIFNLVLKKSPKN